MKTLLIFFLSTFAIFAQVNVTQIESFNQGIQSLKVNDTTIITLERTGKLYTTINGFKSQFPIIEIDPIPSQTGEQGALSVIHKNINGIDFVWIYYIEQGVTPRKGTVKYWTIDIQQNASNTPLLIYDGFLNNTTIHNGGQLYYKDEKLYLSLGDDNNFWNAQNDTKPNGKILELDPFNYNENPIHYAKGIRNGFRGFLFNDWFYQGIVGNASWEWLTIIKEPNLNCGYPFKQGYATYQTTIPNNPLTGAPYELTNEILPLFAYHHVLNEIETVDSQYNIGFIGGSGSSIVPAGIVSNWGYNGNSIAVLDFYVNDILLVDLNNTYDEVVNVRVLTGDSNMFLNSDGFVDNNEMYITTLSGKLLKVIYDETLSLSEHEFDKKSEKTFYDVLGREVTEDYKGVLIVKQTLENRVEISKQIRLQN